MIGQIVYSLIFDCYVMIISKRKGAYIVCVPEDCYWSGEDFAISKENELDIKNMIYWGKIMKIEFEENDNFTLAELTQAVKIEYLKYLMLKTKNISELARMLKTKSRSSIYRLLKSVSRSYTFWKVENASIKIIVYISKKLYYHETIEKLIK